MPLIINVGLSRKASKDYQSTGVSINVTAELDQALLAKPAELQRQIDGLYRQAELALDRHAVVPNAPPQEPVRRAPIPARPAARPGRNGNGNGSANGSPMTASQKRAITAIAQRLGLDATEESRSVLGVELDNLSLRQASQFIDHLKGLDQPISNRS